MSGFTQQLRYIGRRLGRAPGFTATTLLTLAVGIGANVAIYAVLRGVLLNPLPYHESGRLVAIWQTAPGLNLPDLNASPATYLLYRDENRTFEDVAMWSRDSVSVTGISEPEEVPALNVTDGFFPTLRVRAAIGRSFTRSDDSPGSPETAMLTYGYWQRRFGGSPSVLGRRIVADGTAREIIGVLPPDFRFMNLPRDLAVILPLRIDRNKVFVGNFSYQTFGRLKPGATIQQASADVARMLPMLPSRFRMAPGINVKMIEEARIGPNLRPLKDDVVGEVGKVLWVIMATVAMVLFIACANVANLLLVRADGRQRELALRAAMGASRTQIARELLLESVALGMAGGVLALGVAFAAIRLLTAIRPVGLPRIDEIALDGPVVLFTFVVSIACGVLFGLIPVFQYVGPKLEIALRSGGRTMSEGRERHRTRNTLVVLQMALALVLLIGSGLMIRTFNALRHVDPGFTAPDQILTLRISIPSAQVKEPERVARMHNDLLDKVAAIPGVEAVALTSSVTMDGNENNDPIFVQDRVYAEQTIPPLRRFKHISPGVVTAMGNRILAGRDLTWTDIHEKRPVVLVSENFAREFWGRPDAALGKRLRENPKGIWREIVGVTGNERDEGVHKAAPTIVYWPLLLKDFWGDDVDVRRGLAFVIRSKRTGSSGFVADVQKAIWSVNPNIPLASVRPVQDIYERSMARTSFTLLMLSIAAGMALLLGIIGVYGVISYSISQRTREIGIRMALGAQPGAVRQMFVRSALTLAGIGIVCGAVAAVPLTRVMQTLLFGVQPLDIPTYVAVSVVLLGAALLAAYMPTRRATAVEPVSALRAD